MKHSDLAVACLLVIVIIMTMIAAAAFSHAGNATRLDTENKSLKQAYDELDKKYKFASQTLNKYSQYNSSIYNRTADWSYCIKSVPGNFECVDSFGDEYDAYNLQLKWITTPKNNNDVLYTKLLNWTRISDDKARWCMGSFDGNILRSTSCMVMDDHQ